MKLLSWPPLYLNWWSINDSHHRNYQNNHVMTTEGKQRTAKKWKLKEVSFILFQGVGSGGDRWGRLGRVALNLLAPFWGPWKFLDKLRGLWKFLDQLEGSGNFLRQLRHFYFNFIGQLRGLQDLLGPIWRPQKVLGQFGWLWKYSNPLWGSWNHLVCIAPPPPWTSINDTSFCSFIVQKFKT